MGTFVPHRLAGGSTGGRFHNILNNDISELLCPYPQSSPNTVIQIEGQAPGDSVIYHCKIGYYYPEGGTMRSTRCQSNFKWSATIPGCHGMTQFLNN